MFPPTFALVVAAMLQDPVVAAPQGETIVTAARSSRTETTSPVLVTVVSGEELLATNERSLPRALARAANLWVQETNLGGGAPTINGLIGNRVLLVLDGVRLNDAATRMVHQTLNSIDPGLVDRIEIVRGPASVLYGSDAMGGAILIWTKRRDPAGDGAEAEARALRADLDLEGHSATEGGRGFLELSGAGEEDGWLAIGAGQTWKDLRAGDGEEQNETGYHGNSFFGSWVHALGSRRSLRATGIVDRELDVPRTDRLITGFGQTEPSNSRWHYTLQEREIFQLTYDDVDAGGFVDGMQARVSLRRYDEQREIQGLGSSTLRDERDEIETAVVGVDWKKSLGDDHLLTFGVDVANDWIDSTREDTDLGTGTTTPGEGAFADDSRYTASGVFVQDEILALEPWTLTAGLRYSYFDFAFDDFAGNGGGRESGSFGSTTASLTASRAVGDGARVTGSLSQGFRAPNLEDLANNGSFAGGEEIANADLDPERNLTAHVALDVVRARWSASIGVFYTAIDDLIGRRLLDEGDPGTTGDETYLRSNVGEGEIWGVDLFGRHELGAHGTPWSLGGAIGYTLGRQYDDTIDPLTGTAPYDDVPFRRIPPLHGNVVLRWDDVEPEHRVDWAELALVWAATQNELNPDDESDPRIDPDGTEGWAVVDFDLGGPLGDPAAVSGGRARATWTVGAHNVFDENYRIHGSGFDAAGRSLVVGLHFSF
jgi:outer membrane receptor protein involved in Fe transport